MGAGALRAGHPGGAARTQRRAGGGQLAGVARSLPHVLDEHVSGAADAAQRRVFHNADEHLGEGAAQSLALHENGYLFCGFTDRQAQTLKADVDHLHDIGISHIEYLDADAVRRRYPGSASA
ncbi:MAG: hypothetical protein U0521_23940 [Anaerolineae bacterium]